MCLQLLSKLHGVTFQKMVISELILRENSESRNLTGLLVEYSKVLNFVWGLNRLKRVVSWCITYRDGVYLTEDTACVLQRPTV